MTNFAVTVNLMLRLLHKQTDPFIAKTHEQNDPFIAKTHEQTDPLRAFVCISREETIGLGTPGRYRLGNHLLHPSPVFKTRYAFISMRYLEVMN